MTIRLTLPPGIWEAEVALDGAAVPMGALLGSRKVNPGKHVITANLADYEEAKAEKTIEPASTSEIVLTFRKSGQSAPPKEKGETVGSSVVDGASSPKRSTWVFVGFGVGAAGLVAGEITGVLSMGKASDTKEGCADGHCPRENQERRTAPAPSAPSPPSRSAWASWALESASRHCSPAPSPPQRHDRQPAAPR